MSSPSPSPPSEGDEVAQAAENPVITSRSLMVGSSPISPRNSSSGSLDVSNRSNTSTVRQSAASAPPNIQSNPYHVEDLVPVSVADAGLNAYGCVFVEVWLMNPDGTALSRVEPGGHWMDPSFANSLSSEELTEMAFELNRFARDCPPGAGLAGNLFKNADFNKRRVTWRQIQEMLNDPFVQRNSGQRMKRLHKIGIGLVGSVPFSFQDENGLVCFFSRHNADLTLLRSSMNEGFLIGSTDLIGSQIAIRKNREACAAMRREMFIEAIKKVKREILNNVTNNRPSFGDLATNRSTLDFLAKQRREAQDPLEQDDMATRIKKKVIKLGKKVFKRINNSRKKWKGTKLEGPPRQSFGESAFVAFGVFFTMLTVLKVANAINAANANYKFNGSWYSSTLCIIFALTPAPVGQPRQIFAAHLWNMLVGLALRQIPTGPEDFPTRDFMEWDYSASYGLPLIWKQALAVAFGVAGQAKLGILHPPATGLSYTFVSSDKYSWGTILTVYLADVIVVAMSMIILNLSEAKQYPLYWLGLEWGDAGRFRFFGVQARGHHAPLTKSVSNKLTGRTVSMEGDDRNV